MTEKQIERVHTKIARVKRALAADKKEWGSLNYFRWFSKNFPDDVCYGEFYLKMK